MNVYRNQRNYGCRIHDQYTYFGMRTLVMENDYIRISLLLDKGTEIYELLYKPLDLDYMWLSEKGVHPFQRGLSASQDSQFSYIDSYIGGWQEIFPNGGVPSNYLGASYGQHGEVTHLPWDYEIVEDTAEQIKVTFSVKTRLMPFYLKKTLTLQTNSAKLHIQEEVTNLSGEPKRYMWGQHIALGKPFLEEGCRIQLPADLKVITEEPNENGKVRVQRGMNHVWPHAQSLEGTPVDLSILPAPGTPSDIVYLTGFQDKGWYRVDNDRLQATIQVDWDAKEMPYLWYWQEFGGTKQYPWYGRHYNVGLEPFSSFPTGGLAEAVRNGSAGTIGGGETKTFSMAVTLMDNKDANAQ